MGKARDQAGNIWETDAQGNAVRLIQPAAGPFTDPRLQYQTQSAAGAAAAAPLERPKAQADIAKTTTDTAATRATLPYAAPKAAAETQSAQEAAAQAHYKTQQEQLATTKQELEKFGGVEQVNQLINAVEKAKALINPYTTGWGGALLKNMPATEAKTLDNVITQEVRGNVFLQRLQAMKDENPSPNGGTGIGRIMQAEIPMITGSTGALDTTMKGSDLLNSLNQIEHGALRMKAKISGQNPDDEHVLHAQLLSAMHSDGATPNGGPPPVGPANPPAPPGPGGVPHADYSGMVGGPQSNVATLDPNSKAGVFAPTYRTVYDPVGANTLAALIRKGAPYETAAAYAQSHGFNPPDPKAYADAVQFAKAHGGAVNVEADRSVATTLRERMASSPGAAFVMGAAPGLTAGLSDLAGHVIGGDTFDANREALRATNPGADLAGNIAGGAVGMFGGGRLAADVLAAGGHGGAARNLLAWSLKNPGKAAALGDTAYGTTYGAAENPNDPVAGGVTGLVTAPLASAGGQVAAKVVGGATRGVVNPAVQRLQAAGIPLTVGETLGGGFKKAQDAMTSVFGPGNMVARRYAEGRKAMNLAAFNAGGEPINAPIFNVGQAGVDALDRAKSAAYRSALDPVSIDLSTSRALGDIGGAVQSAKAIPNADNAGDIAVGGLRNYIWNPAVGGQMSGRDFQQGYRGLAQLRNSTKDRVYGHEIGNALGQGQDALVNALEAQNPGAYLGFRNANTANRNLNVLANAVDAAKNQISDGGDVLFTPAQLGTAASANAKKYGSRISAASGNRPFNQLINDAQQVMSSKLPESGTFPRQLMGAALTGGLAAPGGMFGAHENGVEGAAEGGLGTLAALSLLGTRRGQQLLTASLLNRPQRFVRIGNYIMRNPELGGDLATAGSLQLLP